ncbi:MAG: hypothetical protein RRC07_16370 [Anaerolineae bacterium]|nr:hypothetical protein [Anaerolineae bacterium]
MHRNWLFLVLFILLFVAGCAPAGLEAPALLPRAELPTVVPAAEAIAANTNPPTWTPAARGPASADSFRMAAAAKPTDLPTVTPWIPTRTPIPPTPTPTVPTPTATRFVRTIPNLPPTDALGPSKLGLHVIRNNDPNIMNFVRQAQPAVMKAVDDVGFLTEVKEASPRTITIGRINASGPHYEQNPEQAARDFVTSQLEQYRLNPGVDYWEGYNEPDPNHDGMVWYSRFEQERVKALAEYGFRAAIGGFATGVPEFDEFELFTAAIWVAKEHRGILSLHEYSAPVMTYGFGANLPEMAPDPNRGALTFRYRWFYEEMLIPFGLDIPLVISEAGIDGIIGHRPGPSGLGWRDFGRYWVEQGIGESPEQAYINQLAWYDAGVRADGYVIGFTVFTAGGFGQWESYNVNSILPQLTAYAASQH